MPLTELALRLGMALAAGACIGIERQWHQHRAGLRTNVLVALGAALFVALGAMTPGESSPTRIASYVVSGVGFLGAGAIIRDGLDVRGLNTAATLWCAAAVGALAGFGYFPAATLGALAVLGTNIMLRPVARRLTRTTPTAEAPVAYTVMVRCRRTRETAIRAMILRQLQRRRWCFASCTRCGRARPFGPRWSRSTRTCWPRGQPTRFSSRSSRGCRTRPTCPR